MKYFYYVFSFLIIIFGISFVSLNKQTVNLNYYFGTIEFYLPILLFISLVLGVMLGILVMLPKWIRLANENRKLKHKIKSR